MRKEIAMKILVTLALLSSVAAAPAMAESFTRDGLTYDYETTSVGADRLIVGKIKESGKDFRLLVSGNKVSGRVGTVSVRFKVDSATTAMAPAGATVMAVN